MCSAENIMGSKLMLAAGIKSAKIKDEPLLKHDPFESTKLIKGSSFKQVSYGKRHYCDTCYRDRKLIAVLHMFSVNHVVS